MYNTDRIKEYIQDDVISHLERLMNGDSGYLYHEWYGTGTDNLPVESFTVYTTYKDTSGAMRLSTGTYVPSAGQKIQLGVYDFWRDNKK